MVIGGALFGFEGARRFPFGIQVAFAGFARSRLAAGRAAFYFGAGG